MDIGIHLKTERRMGQSINRAKEAHRRLPAAGSGKHENFLIPDDFEGNGVYVVTDGPDSKVIVATSVSPATAVAEAKRAGAVDPILVYVPTDDERVLAL
jgi:hypothetical protein